MAGAVVGELIGLLTLEDKFSDPFKKIANGLGFGAEAFSKVAVGAGIAVAAIGAVTAAIKILGERGATVGDVQQQFAVLSQRVGETSDAMIGALRKGTVGAISDFELMKVANKALGDGLRVNATDMETLASGARLLAKRVGGDTTQAFESLTKSIATGRVMSLAQLGLFVDQKKALEDYARSIGKTTGDLSKQEQQIGLQAAALKALRMEIGAVGAGEADFGEKLEALNVRFTNFLDNLSVAINDSPVFGALLDGIGEILDAVFGGTGQGKIKTITALAEGFGIGLAKVGQVGLYVAQAFYMAWKLVETAIYGLSTVLGAIFTTLGKMVTWALQAASHIPGIGDKFVGAAEAAAKWTQTTWESTKTLAGYTAEAAKGVVAQDEMSAKFSASREILGKTIEKMEGLKGTTVETNTASNAFNRTLGTTVNTMEKANGPLEALTKKIKDMQAAAALASKNDQLKFWAENNANALRSLSDEAVAMGVKLPAALQAAVDAANKFEFKKIFDKASGEIGKELEDRAKQAIDAMNDKLSKGFEILATSSKNAGDLYRRRTMDDYEYQVDLIRREQDEKIQALESLGMATSENLSAIQLETTEKMEAAKEAHNAAIAEMEASWNSWGNMAKGWMDQIPGLLKSAFTGGGGFGGAAKGLLSQIGGDIGNKLFGGPNGLGQKLATGLLGSGKFSAGMAGMIGSTVGSLATAGLSLAAPLVIAGIKKLVNIGKPSKEELAGRESVAKIEEALNASLTAQQKLESGGQTWKGTVIAVRDAYKLVGKSQQEAEAATKALWEASKKGPEAVAEAYKPIQEAMKKAQDAQNLLNSTLARYKFTEEELGPALARQELDKKMQQLYSDWEVLTAAGIDTNAIIREMGGSVAEFVKKAIKTGTEVPEAMRPMLEQMAKAGQLTDENGNLITDLEAAGVNFSLTMTEGFKMVADSVKDLVNVIKRQLGIAIEETANDIRNIPDVNVDVIYNDPGYQGNGGINPGGGNGGPPEYNPEEGRAFGSPNMMFENWGRGTPVTLHGNEAVINTGQGATLADMVLEAVKQGQVQNLQPVPAVIIEGMVVQMVIPPNTDQRALADQFAEMLRTQPKATDAISVIAQRAVGA